MVLHTNDPRVSHARIKFPSEGASMSKGEGKKVAIWDCLQRRRTRMIYKFNLPCDGHARSWRRRGGWLVDLAQGSAKRQSPGLVIVVPALAYHFCPALLAGFTQPGTHLFAKPSRGDGIASRCD